ncbi:acyl-CoA thioesterase [Desulfohalovibrio reitneri]|uniref:acyl-CoA thioesterase n=1 Tax=Desulfohalovibrio reitneri TaxID=1307759 RepID=UPI0004A6E231|nr:acyl-CoA thioesterase [Desulfohalovibrio reitneri]
MDERQGRPVGESRFVLTRMMEPQDTNPFGSVHGGVIMKNIDVAAAVAAMRHCRCNTVTVSIDRLDFHLPVKVGDLVFFKSSVNGVGRTSLEVGVRVEVENLYTGKISHVASAYLTFVSMGPDNHPTETPRLIPETQDDQRRMEEAEERRQARARAKAEAGG